MRRALSRDQLKTGRLRALQNAEELLAESNLLFNNDCWARAIYLSHTVAEEIGKYILLTSALIHVIGKSKSFAWQEFWRRYLSHTEKSKHTISFQVFIKALPRDIPGYPKGVDWIVSALEFVRKMSLYSGFYKDNFYCPTELLTKEEAANALEWAGNHVRWIREIERSVWPRWEAMDAEAFRSKITVALDKAKERLSKEKKK